MHPAEDDGGAHALGGGVTADALVDGFVGGDDDTLEQLGHEVLANGSLNARGLEIVFDGLNG